MNPAIPPLRPTSAISAAGGFGGAIAVEGLVRKSIALPQRVGEGNVRHASDGQTAERADDISGTLLGPVRFALLYWAATFIIFLFSNLTAEVRNMGTLVAFVLACFSGFYVGYRAGIGRLLPQRVRAAIPQFGYLNTHVALVLAGSAYFLLWGVNQLVEFDVTNPVAIVQAVLSPGEAYKAKFEIAEFRMASQHTSTLGQILVVSSIFYAILVPLLVASWQHLPRFVRMCGIIAIGAYIISFLAIGTLKGLGDVVLFMVAGLSVVLGKRRLASGFTIGRRRVYMTLILVGASFFSYMLVSQLQRAEQFQIIESPIVGDVSKTFIAQQFGQEAAYGFYTILAYPSHGYAGLAFNLEQSFVFSNGAGISFALESYRQQYFGGADNRFLTYPYRTELATGWDAEMFWSTALPWFASDVSFVGVPFLLALLGFLYARLWLASLYGNNPLTLGGLGLIIMFIAFMPANNQVLFSRQGLWAVITLLTVGALVAMARRNPAR